ncbi:hypothetical protein GCM10022405_05720 [Gibbsiella dentisursi]|uniref:Uncharacterized protein n=1 Tax=Gibbsiella dentisursi TaxID=796890 RepID=A0ABP7KNR7_9GAMM
MCTHYLQRTAPHPNPLPPGEGTECVHIAFRERPLTLTLSHREWELNVHALLSENGPSP